MVLNTSHWIDQNEISKYLQDVRKYDTLTREEEEILLDRINKYNCEASKERLINSNLRFVISVAKAYQNKGLSFPDLISEGNYGLIKAVEKFNNKDNNVRFLSYAVWWIKQSITQALNQDSRAIRLPTNIINDLYKESKNKPFKEFETTNLSTPSVGYLNDYINEEGNTFYDVVEDIDSLKPDDNLDNEQLQIITALRAIVKDLTDIEQIVISNYYGLYGEEKSLQSIADDLGLTKERVRQIKERSIKKLRDKSMCFFNLMNK